MASELILIISPELHSISQLSWKPSTCALLHLPCCAYIAAMLGNRLVQSNPMDDDPPELSALISILQKMPNVSCCKPLSRLTLSRLWSKRTPNVSCCKPLGKPTLSGLWLKLTSSDVVAFLQRTASQRAAYPVPNMQPLIATTVWTNSMEHLHASCQLRRFATALAWAR